MSKTSQDQSIAVTSNGESLAAFAGFALLATAGIKFLNGAPLEYRANCEKSMGNFMLNGTSNEGDSIKMRILNFKIHEQIQLAEIFGVEDVVEVIFIDSNDAVSSILFRTFSKDNFVKLMQTLQVKGTPPATQVVTAKMAKKTSNNNTYHIVEFSAENSTPEAVSELKEFYGIAPEAFDAFTDFSERAA